MADLIWDIDRIESLARTAHAAYASDTLNLIARIRDLEADRDSWSDQAAERLKDWDDMRVRAETAEQRIRELEQDAALLDFIESHAEPDREWHVRVLLTGKGFRLRQERIPGEKTVRSAIAAAMAASAKGGKDAG